MTEWASMSEAARYEAERRRFVRAVTNILAKICPACGEALDTKVQVCPRHQDVYKQLTQQTRPPVPML